MTTPIAQSYSSMREALLLAQWLETLLPHKEAFGFVFNPADELGGTGSKPYGWALRGVATQTERMQLVAVENNGYALQFATEPSDVVILQAITTSPGILFDHRFDRKITAATLDRLRPGLVKDIEQMKAILGVGESLRGYVKTSLSNGHLATEPVSLPELD